MSNSIGEIALDLVVNPSKFKQQMNGITKTAKSSTGQLSAMFGKVGVAVAAAFSVKAIVGFSKECLKLGSDLAEVQNVVDVTFGSMSGAVDNWAKNAMSKFGMSEKVAKEYMGQFGAMSKAFGNTEKMAYDQAAALTGLAGDVASFYNMTTDEAFTKLKAVYTGETEALKSLGVVMTQAALDEYALAQGYGKTTKAMSEQEKVSLRLAFVTDRLSGASGDFVRTADGWANQTRVLALRFDAIKASIGQGLINALLPVVRVLNALLERLQVVADAFSNFMGNLFGNAGSTSSAISSAASGTGAISSNLGDAASSAKAIKKSLAGFDQLNILSSGSDSSSGAGTSGGGTSSGGSGTVDTEISAGAAAAGKLKGFLAEVKTKLIEIANISGLTGLWNDFLVGANNAKLGVKNLFSSLKNAIVTNAPNFESLKTSLINTFLTISNTITTIWGDIWVGLTDGFRAFTETNGPAIEEFFAGALGVVTNFCTLISDVVGGIYASINAWWEEDGKRIWSEIVSCLQDIGVWLLELWNNGIKPVCDWIIQEATDLWETYLKPLWDKILSLITSLWDAIKAFWDNVLKPIVDWILEYLVPPIRDAIMGLVTVIKNVIGTISTVIGGIVDTLKAVLDFVTDGFKNGWNNAWENLKKKFVEIWSGIKNTIAKPLNGILSGIETFINNIIKGINVLINAINKISFDVPDWVPGIGGKKLGFNIPKVSTVSLPRLATGGYVAANTPQLAIIGDNKREGEIVAPESKITEAVVAAFRQFLPLFNNGGNNKPIYLTLKLGDGTFWEGFVDYHNDIVKRTGDTPLLI
jgi:phage-related protein